MTVKGTSSLQRTTYFHLCFHDSTLIFQKQLISLDSGITGLVGVLARKRWITIGNPWFWPRIQLKRWISVLNPCFRTPSTAKSRGRLNFEATPADDLGFFDRLDFVTQFLDRFADIVS